MVLKSSLCSLWNSRLAPPPSCLSVCLSGQDTLCWFSSPCSSLVCKEHFYHEWIKVEQSQRHTETLTLLIATSWSGKHWRAYIRQAYDDIRSGYSNRRSCFLCHPCSSMHILFFLLFSCPFFTLMLMDSSPLMPSRFVGSPVPFVYLCMHTFVWVSACVLMYVCVCTRGGAQSSHSFIQSVSRRCVTHHSWQLQFKGRHFSFILILHWLFTLLITDVRNTV